VFHLASGLSDVGIKTELLSGGSVSAYHLGVSAERITSEYLVSSDSSYDLRSSPTLLSAFAENRRSVGRWFISAGLRARSVIGSGPAIEPRLSVRYHISPVVTVSLGAARLHQYVQSMRNEESMLDYLVGAELPIAVGADGLHPARSDQVMGELALQPGKEWSLVLSGYTRLLTGVLAPALTGAGPFAAGSAPRAAGRARGVELLASYRPHQTVLMVNLGVAESERSSGELEFDPMSSHDGWIAVGASQQFGDKTMLRFTTKIVSGAPTSVYRGRLEWQSPGGVGNSGEIAGSPDEIFGAVDGTLLPTYYRSDLGVMHAWHVSMGRRPGLLTTNLTITNLFDRQNVLGYIMPSHAGPRHSVSFSPRSLVAQVSFRF
jgi:hypothetical protein